MAITFLNLVLLIIFHSSMTTFSLKSTTIVTDQSALLELKNHISHDPENVLATNWSVSTPVCNWFGVSCGSKHRRVTALDLTGLGLSLVTQLQWRNPIVVGIFNSTSNADFVPKQLPRCYPILFRQFVKAREVELPDYRLSGGIPANLFKGRELQVLSISYNQLEGKLQGEIGNLSKLQCLAIDHNHFQGNASKLTLLEMSSNYFSGSIPNDLGNLRNLRSLNLEENNLISLEMRFLSSLTNCRGLEKLKFGHNPLISGELPGLLGNLSGSLQIFYGFRCNISGRIPSELGNLSSLIRVELANNKLAGSIPPTIGRLKELQGLSLEDNKLEGAFKSFDVECEVLRNIRHRNLIKIISSCSNDFDFKALVLEFMPNGSLDKWLYSDNHSLDILQRLNILIHIASAL
ncbi:putative receptor-like protein kinase At3g47110 [Hibiscus syriacus]|uniref:putative receptor-like protein kinase At3g47110 n=1 Tax=Hibiscus syriacus TaxID=106335 RepID=UPI0019243751|nr:putative receptor-like protein kinase At3g47110 [Hibiscus syriacus]